MRLIERSSTNQGRYLGRPFWVFLLASCLFNVGMFIFVLLYNLYLLDLGFKEDFLGLVASVTTTGNIVGTFATVALNRRLGLKASVLVFFAGMPIISALRAVVTGQLALLGMAF